MYPARHRAVVSAIRDARRQNGISRRALSEKLSEVHNYISDLAATFQLSRQTIHDYVTVLGRIFLLERPAHWRLCSKPSCCRNFDGRLAGGVTRSSAKLPLNDSDRESCSTTARQV